MIQLRIVHPPNNRTLVETSVSSDLSGTPALVEHESGRLETETGKMRILSIWHVHTVSQGDAKVLNHYKPLTHKKYYVIICKVLARFLKRKEALCL